MCAREGVLQLIGACDIDPVMTSLSLSIEHYRIVKEAADNVEKLLRTEFRHVKVFTEHFAVMKKLLEPLTSHGSSAWADVADLPKFQTQLCAVKEILKLCQLDGDSNALPSGGWSLPPGQLLPLPVVLVKDKVEEALAVLHQSNAEKKQPPADKEQLSLWERQEQREREVPLASIEPVSGSFAAALLTEPCYWRSYAQRSLSVAAAAYGKFVEPNHGLDGRNEWSRLLKTRVSDVVVFGVKESDGKCRLEIGIRGTVPSYTDQWFFDAGNAKIDLVSMEGMDEGKVHAGFWLAYTDGSPSMQDAVRARVRKELAARKVSEVLVSGHSRGAALATLCAVDLALHFKDQGLPCVDLVTYASPRVGDANFVDKCCATLESQARLRSARFVNRFDPVTHMPAQHGSLGDAMQRFLLGDLGQSGYKHLGQPVVLDWYLQNTLRFLHDPKTALAGVHDLERYGENLRNRFRDVRSVCMEASIPLAMSAMKYVGIFCASKIVGDAVLNEMRMEDLEKGMKKETAEIKNTVVEQVGLVLDSIGTATESIKQAITDSVMKGKLDRLKCKTETLRIQLAADMPENMLYCTRTHEAVVELLLAAQDAPAEEHENLLVLILQALEAVGTAYLTWGLPPAKLLTWMREVAQDEKMVTLLVGVCNTKVQGLSRCQVQKFLQDFTWPEDKDGGDLIPALRKVQRLIALIVAMCRDSAGVGIRELAAKRMNPDDFEDSPQESWDGWRLTVSEEGKRSKQVVDVNGSCFQGHLQDGVPEGFGEASYAVGGVKHYHYVGGWRNGLFHGQGKYTLPDGTVVHNGVWNHGQPVQLQKVVDCLVSLAEMLQHIMPQQVFTQALDDAQLRDLEHEAALQELQRRVMEEDTQAVSRKLTNNDKLLFGGEGEGEAQGKAMACRDLDERRMRLRTELKQLIVKLSAVCIFCDRAKMTASEELSILKAGIDTPLFEDLQTLAHKLSNTSLRMPIMGPVKSGKSASLNAMAAQRLSPSDTQPMTVLPMVIEHATGLGSPTLSVPFIDIYRKAAERLNFWLTCCFRESPAFLQGYRRIQSDRPQHWKLVKPEMELFQSILESGTLDVESHMELASGPSDAHEAVEKLNRLCRIYARVHLFIVENIIETVAHLEEVYDQLPRPHWSRRIRKSLRMKEQASSSEDLRQETFDLLQKLSLVSGTDMSDLYQSGRQQGSTGGLRAWLFTDRDQEGWEKVCRCVEETLEVVQKKIEQAKVPEWNHGLLEELLQAGAKERRCPWPRMRFNMAIFAQQANLVAAGSELPTSIEIIDTPGLDETCLLPEITGVVKLLLGEAQASTFVCNTKLLGTDAFNEAAILVKEALAFEVPILVLANYMDNVTEKKRKELCKDVAKSIFDTDKSTSKVYPVSARSAFLSSRLQLFHDEGRLAQISRKLLEHLAKVDESADAGKCSRMDPDMEDLFTALDMASPMKLEEEHREELDGDGDELAKQIADEQHVRFHRRKGGFDQFIDDIQKKLAPKALAMEAQSSLKRLTAKNGMLFQMLSVFGDAVDQIMENDGAQEKSEKVWKEFLLAAQDLALRGFNAAYSSDAALDIKTILDDVFNAVRREKREPFKPGSSVATDDDTRWTMAGTTQLEEVKEQAKRHAERVARELAAQMRSKANTKIQGIWDQLNRKLQKDVDALQCPKAGLRSMLKQATLKFPSVTQENIRGPAVANEVSRHNRTFWQWLWGDEGDIAGFHISKAQLSASIDECIESSLVNIKTEIQRSLAETPKEAVLAYMSYIRKLVDAAREQHQEILQRRTSQTFIKTKALLLEVYEEIKECYVKAFSLQREIQEDPFEI